MSFRAQWTAVSRHLLRSSIVEKSSRIVLRRRTCLPVQAGSGRLIHAHASRSSTNTKDARELPLSNPEGRLKNAVDVLTEFASQSSSSSFKPYTSDLVSVLAASSYLLQEEVRNSKYVRVAVYGPDRTPSSRKLVTALLDDPLSSDEELRTRLRDRWKGEVADFIRLGHNPSYTSEAKATPLNSTFLSRFPSPIILEELPSRLPRDLPMMSTLLASDIPVIVISPFVTEIKSITRLMEILPSDSRTIITVNCGLDPDSETALLIKERICYTPDRILFVDIDRALKGLDTLRADPSSASAIRQYQDDFLGSRLPELSALLGETINLGVQQLRTDAMEALTRRLVSIGHSIVRVGGEEIHEVRSRVSGLRSKVLEERVKVVKEVLGGEANEEIDNRTIAQGIERAEKDVRLTIDSLAWWKLPLVVDNISAKIDREVEKAYVKVFENKLVFHTGRLSLLQSHLLSHTNSLLPSPPSSFNSPVLHNTLAQISLSPSFSISATALLPPLHARLRQLAFPTRTLHLAAQRALLTTLLLTVLSGGTASYAWAAALLDAPSAAGAGLIGALLALRWAIGRWDRARRDWWADWGRVGAGLERDVRGALEEVLDRQVCAVPEEACRGLEQLVERRVAELERFEDDIDASPKYLSGVEETSIDETKAKTEN